MQVASHVSQKKPQTNNGNVLSGRSNLNIHYPFCCWTKKLILDPDKLYFIPYTSTIYLTEKAKIFSYTSTSIEGGSFKPLCKQYVPLCLMRKSVFVFTTDLTFVQSKLLKKAGSLLVAEIEEKKRERERVMNESNPPLKMSGLSTQELQVLIPDY